MIVATVFKFPDMGTLAERLSWALTHAGQKPSELAAHLKISRSAVYQWLNGDTKEITPKHLFSAARFLGVEPEWLGAGFGARTPDEKQVEDEVRPLGVEAVAVARRYINGSDAERAAFRTVFQIEAPASADKPARRKA